ncbi:MAG: alpha-amylase family glycosyl hydrolase, partial [Candidatus Limnocylindrales bacterium]
RLWWPEPGSGGGIPSRSEHALAKAAFDAAMPHEFWREVVDRVAAEAPDTLLLAEAFWLMEGYFVRTLGMHRVYNSAFMHMLRDENGAGYRKVIRETIEFDPEILKRYVNFMTNPDEETAVEQFGRGDKYFGVATVLATLPGLPMLGHGQVQGFGEKYGMEFRRATLDEQPDGGLVERHEREIFPLLHRRAWFAEARDFLLYDLLTDHGAVDEHVLAYSNGTGRQRSLVLYHDRFASTHGAIRDSAAYALKSVDGTKRLVRRSLAEGLGLPNEASAFVIFRDARTGLESIRSCRELWEHGLRLSLDAYEAHVYWEFREVHDGVAGQWARLAERLGRASVPSLDEALRELQLEPVHGPLRDMFVGGVGASIVDASPSDAELVELESRIVAFLGALSEATAIHGDVGGLAAAIRTRTGRALPAMTDLPGRVDRAGLLGWLVLARTGELAPSADVAATSRAWFDELRLDGALATGLRGAGLDEAEAWGATELVRVLLALPRPSPLHGPARTADLRLLDQWLARDVVRTAIGANTWQGVEYVDRDGFEAMLRWAARLGAIDGPGHGVGVTGTSETGRPGFATRWSAAAEAAGYRVDRLRQALAPPSPPRTRRGSPRARSTRPPKST